MKNTTIHPQQPPTLNQKCSFVLRIWRDEPSGTTPWHASVENPETGKRIGFASLEQLFAFLIDYTEHNCDLPASYERGKELRKL